MSAPTSSVHRHGARREGGCDCGHDHHHHHPRRASEGGGGFWGAALAALACAVCPACLSTYAKVLSALGVGATLSEGQHHALLGFAVGTSLLVSAWRSWASGRLWPAAVAVVGCSLVTAGHFGGDLGWVEWLGVLTLLGGGLGERLLRPRASGAAPAGS